MRFAGIEHRSHSVSRTGKLTEFRYHRVVAAPSHAVCAGAAKPDHPQLCVTSDLAPRDLLWRQRESPLRAAICPGSAGWLVLRILRLPQGLEPLLASEQPGDRCRRAERTASGYGQPDAGCRGVIRYLQQDDGSVSAEWVTGGHDRVFAARADTTDRNLGGAPRSSTTPRTITPPSPCRCTATRGSPGSWTERPL